jgi:hypothetical protein
VERENGRNLALALPFRIASPNRGEHSLGFLIAFFDCSRFVPSAAMWSRLHDSNAEIRALAR